MVCVKERDSLKDLGIDRIISGKYIFGKWGWRMWFGFVWLRMGIVGGLL
jgi:hypothetical protein